MMPQIPPQLILATAIEAILVLVTCLLLVQPESMFSRVSDLVRRVTTYAGMLSLCLTFCWSVIFGCVLALNDLVLRI